MVRHDPHLQSNELAGTCLCDRLPGVRTTPGPGTHRVRCSKPRLTGHRRRRARSCRRRCLVGVHQRMPRRAFGVAGIVLGVGGIVVALVRATTHGDQVVLRLVVLAVIFAVSVGLGRLALAQDLRAHDELRRVSSALPAPGAPLQPLVGRREGGEVRTGRPGRGDLGVEVVMLGQGLDLEQLARDAIARGADCLGMAGGDGSQALVASIAIEHDLPFVCVSAGTRNHFALDLGIDREDPRLGLDAFHDGSNAGSTTPRSAIGCSSTTSRSASTPPSCSRRATARPRSDTTRAMLPELLGRTAGTVRSSVHRSGGGSRRRVPDPGVEQPLRAREPPWTRRSVGGSTRGGSESWPSRPDRCRSGPGLHPVGAGQRAS